MTTEQKIIGVNAHDALLTWGGCITLRTGCDETHLPCVMELIEVENEETDSIGASPERLPAEDRQIREHTDPLDTDGNGGGQRADALGGIGGRRR